MTPKQNEEVEQHLTISSSGRIWLSRYGFSLTSSYPLLKKEYAKIVKESADTLFAYLQEYLRHPDNSCVCDAGVWTLTIRYDDRPALSISGPMMDQVYVGDVNISDWIRKNIPLKNLMAFGDDGEDA
ncbi:MAG: hypothetical protein PUE16_07715 [Lactimicrobium massiliense]|nr:hypothetical protein [Lactimicrobium massiliense]MDD6727204.1 hypothetical protein [Lactimicrobium massiliense]